MSDGNGFQRKSCAESQFPPIMKILIAILPILWLHSSAALATETVQIETEVVPARVTASSEYGAAQTVRNLVNGSGLADDRHDADGSAATMWHTGLKPAPSVPAPGLPAVPAWVRFDFGGETGVSISAIRVWNHNQSVLTNRGFRKVRVYATGDGKTWREVAGGLVEMKQGGEAPLEIGTTDAAKGIKSVILAAESNHGGDCYGLSEVKFVRTDLVALDQVPPPSGLDCVPQPTYLQRSDGKAGREITVKLTGGKLYTPAELVVKCEGMTETIPVAAHPNGISQVTAMLPDGKGVTKSCQAEITLRSGRHELSRMVVVPPEKQLTIYLLMHSHVDIGYTAVQPEIAKKQASNVSRALELIQQTRDFPEGSRFKWNLEVYWPAQQFLKTATDAQKAEFATAVREGNIGIDAMHTNLLTGVCRAEELVRAFEAATELARVNGAKAESMMISDVPGLTWGVVPALCQAGVTYISDGPNAAVGLVGDRIGHVRVLWENQPFWWVGPNGRDRVLYWGAQGGYSFGHHYGSFGQGLKVLLGRLKEWNYAHDVVQMRWTKGDNGEADAAVMPAVREWNAKYAYPKVIIATTAEAFKAFEKRCGDKLPEFKGDFTPYWEDGVGSGAREAGINRLSADRLARAETLWTMFHGAGYPMAYFRAAWDNVLLWSEHTWGAHCSISQPDSEFTKAQWAVKQGFALNGEMRSNLLLVQALALRGMPTGGGAVDVFNTASWERTDLVTLSREQSAAGDRVVDDAGNPVPSQRLTTGELVFFAEDVPALGGRRYTVAPGAATAPAKPAVCDGNNIANERLLATLDPKTGAVSALKARGLEVDLADAAKGINSYIYLPGGNVKDAVPNGVATLRVTEKGPLVVALVAESAAPGCRSLTREVRLIAGSDRLEFINTVDKLPIRAKEGVHFGFGFKVPGCETRINSPWAIARVETDQIPGACRNWYSVERWADVSNTDFGVTLATIEAPLLEVGGLTANLPSGQPDPNAYLKHIESSATLYSWAMNNHWHTNYRADQEGPTRFRYAVRPHGPYDCIAATRFGIEATQPLLVAPAAGEAPKGSLVTLDQPGVIVNSLKPGNDGKAMILRLFNPTGTDLAVNLTWAAPAPREVFVSNLAEAPVTKLQGPLAITAGSVVTLRVER